MCGTKSDSYNKLVCSNIWDFYISEELWISAAHILCITNSVLAMPYLMALYVILPIHVNFPIRSRCVLKAIIHRKKQWIVLCYLRKFLFFIYCTGMINFSILSQFVPIFHIYLSIIYQLYDLILREYCCIRPIKEGLVFETSLDLICILSYCFYLVHVIYYFYLTKFNLSIYFYSISQVYDKQRKKHFSVVICMCSIMSCSGVCQNSMGCNKIISCRQPWCRPLVNTIV